MKNYIRLLLFAFFLSSLGNIHASSYVGADLTYTCLGGNTYLITFSYYKDCSGSTEPAQMTLNLNCSSNSSFNFTATLNKIPGTGQEVTPGCYCDSTTCQGGTRFGCREFVYSAIQTLAPCNVWSISANGCCRNTVTTSGIGLNTWYLEATLNNLSAPCNSSPTFSNKPLVYLCNNHSFCYNQGAIDPDGDSLVYSFASPRTSATTYVTYNTPYSHSNFLSCFVPPGITLDPTTGDICLQPNGIHSSITGVKVEEWRKINGVSTLVGVTYRDLQFRVQPCSNEIPVLSGMDTLNTHTYNPNDTVFLKSWHVGQTVDFDINGYDADTVNPNCNNKKWEYFIIWNNGIPSGSFTPFFNGSDSAYAHFSWVPTVNDVSQTPHCFTSTIQDDACPYNGTNTFAYCVRVLPSTIGINESQENQNIKVFPNPSSDIIDVEYNTDGKEDCAIQIINMEGKIVLEDYWTSPKNQTLHRLNLSALPPGVYYLSITQGIEIVKTKVILTK